MQNNPAMNSQSVHPVPAQEWNVEASGPTATDPRKPRVGEPPWIHAPAVVVE
ncbi:hypothetical protein [Amycolatopsis sp. NPDC051903]|uniref:hypothetical protein n=1 Tax=Amycolatopsis sp. NPDC051903 TaxID=3363936 RepID=UPI0037B323C1